MNVIIKTIPHAAQRYDTCGDWWWEGDSKYLLQIRVSEMCDVRYEWLVIVHELVEVLCCRHDGVTQKQVDDFDMDFEKRRKKGNTDEPGDDANAPYRQQHCIATGVERLLAFALGVCWADYEKEINQL